LNRIKVWIDFRSIHRFGRPGVSIAGSGRDSETQLAQTSLGGDGKTSSSEPLSHALAGFKHQEDKNHFINHLHRNGPDLYTHAAKLTFRHGHCSELTPTALDDGGHHFGQAKNDWCVDCSRKLWHRLSKERSDTSVLIF
jgi:hypothetical protein